MKKDESHAPSSTTTTDSTAPSKTATGADSAGPPKQPNESMGGIGPSYPSRRQTYFTVAQVAPRLGITPEALRARLRRAERREGTESVARLGAGVVGYRFGSTWRLYLTQPSEP